MPLGKELDQGMSSDIASTAGNKDALAGMWIIDRVASRHGCNSSLEAMSKSRSWRAIEIHGAAARHQLLIVGKNLEGRPWVGPCILGNPLIRR